MQILCIKTPDLRVGDIFLITANGYTCYKVLDTLPDSPIHELGPNNRFHLKSKDLRVEEHKTWGLGEIKISEKIVDFNYTGEWLTFREEDK